MGEGCWVSLLGADVSSGDFVGGLVGSFDGSVVGNAVGSAVGAPLGSVLGVAVGVMLGAEEALASKTSRYGWSPFIVNVPSNMHPSVQSLMNASPPSV